MKKRFLFVMLLVTALATTAAAVQREQQLLSGKLIRLHVVANSDSPEDQRIKLLVRDAVLRVTDGVTREELAQSIPEIERAAKACLQKQGCDDAVRVKLGVERFPTKSYDNFALPSGVYQSLRVTIGEGAGQNWWCVVFPSICFRATASELEEAAVSAGFTEEELALITSRNGGYELKFKCMEWLEKMKGIFY